MCNAPVGFADVDPVTGNVTLETVKAAVEAASFKVRVIAVISFGRSTLRYSCDQCLCEIN